MSCSFPKALKIRTRKQYQRLSYKGSRCLGSSIILEFCPHSYTKTRLGITVSRKYGKAHERNRFKRMVREAFRTGYHLLPTHLDVNVKPRGHPKNLKMGDIQQELICLLQQNASASASR